MLLVLFGVILLPFSRILGVIFIVVGTLIWMSNKGGQSLAQKLRDQGKP